MTSEIRANTLKNRVGLGTVSYTNTGIVVSGIVTANSFSGPYNGTDIVGTGITLTSTDAGSAAGPEVKLFRNSASPADADYLGQIKFAGESDTGVERNYAKITGKILDASNGTEDGILEFAHIKAGSQVITGRWRSDSLQLLNGTALTVSGNATIGETLNISGDNPNITFADTNSNPDFQIYASNGAFTIRDSTNATNRFSINSVGNATFAGDLDVDGHTNLDNVSIAGVTTFASNVFLGDDDNLYLGASNDLRIYHDAGAASHINAVGLVNIDGTTGVRLEYNNANRVYCTSSGVTLGGDIEIADKIVHEGDTNTAIRFPTNDVISFEIAGNEKFRLDTSGNARFGGGGTTANTDGVHIYHASSNQVLLCESGDAYAHIGIRDNSTHSSGTYFGVHGNDFRWVTHDGSSSTEKLRITSDGSVNIGGDYTQTSRKFKVTGNSTFDGGIVFTGTLEGSGFSVNGGNVIMPAFIAHDGDSNTKFGFAAADRFTVETAGNERLRIDENGKIIVATGTLHSTRVLARFGIDCHGMNIFDGVGVVANYGMAFYNDPNTNYANGIGFFNDDGQSCGGYIVHQDKGGSNVGDIIMATAATANNPVERLRISSLGNIKQNLTSPSGTSPYQNTHWYDREGGHYTLTAIDNNYLSATKTDSNNGYNDVIYKRVRMSKNCDIEFELSGNSPAGTYRHVGFVINGDGTGTHANWDRLVFRSRPGNTTSNQIRIDKGDGNYGFNETGSYIPTFFDGTERHILIQLRDRLVNVIVDGVVIISQKTNADFNRSQGWFGFGIYEGGENAQVYIRNLTIKNKFQRPHWLVRATGVNASVGNQNAFPFNQVILASSDMSNSSHYNTSNYRYNVPISGLYYCFLRVYRNGGSGSEVAFYVNGSVRNRFRPQPSSGDYIFAGSCLIQLFKGEYIDVRAFNGGFDNFYGNSSQQYSTWGGHLLD